jgi:hypothetical protein
MLDGRIDTKGTTKELRAQGVLDDIAQDAAVEVKKEELAVAKEVAGGDVEAEADPKDADEKKPRKLIKDEHREVGGVKWSIYKSYLQASSYSIWCFLAFVVVLQQFLSVGEKVSTFVLDFVIPILIITSVAVDQSEHSSGPISSVLTSLFP